MRLFTMGAGIAAALAVMGSAHADTIVQNLDFVPVDVLHTGFYSEGYTPRFNPALGTLTDVSVDITGTIFGVPDGSPFMDAIFTDQADHTFSLFGDVFATFGPITPDGVNFTITTDPADAARNAELFSNLYPGGTILDTGIFARDFAGEVVFATDTLTYTYTPNAVPEPGTLAVLLAPTMALLMWAGSRREKRNASAHPK